MWGWIDMLPRYLLVVRRNGFIDTQGNWKEEIMIPRREAGKKEAGYPTQLSATKFTRLFRE